MLSCVVLLGAAVLLIDGVLYFDSFAPPRALTITERLIGAEAENSWLRLLQLINGLCLLVGGIYLWKFDGRL